jgi:MFS transporter, SP family, solute carrier family 2 (myo-inositol transporter), member 13
MADAAQQPLMSHETREEERPSGETDHADVSVLLEKNLRHPGIFVWLLTFSAGISGLLFGCTWNSPQRDDYLLMCHSR